MHSVDEAPSVLVPCWPFEAKAINFVSNTASVSLSYTNILEEDTFLSFWSLSRRPEDDARWRSLVASLVRWAWGIQLCFVWWTWPTQQEISWKGSTFRLRIDGQPAPIPHPPLNPEPSILHRRHSKSRRLEYLATLGTTTLCGFTAQTWVAMLLTAGNVYHHLWFHVHFWPIVTFPFPSGLEGWRAGHGKKQKRKGRGGNRWADDESLHTIQTTKWWVSSFRICVFKWWWW